MITLVYTTARQQCRFDWFFDSLYNCSRREIITQVIIIDFFAQACDGWTSSDVERRKQEVIKAARKVTILGIPVEHHAPKPNVWAGPYRLTPRNWWSKPSDLNTGLCYTKGDYVVFSDDRCVLLPTFLDAVHEAKEGNYAVCGTYEKRVGMEVNDGNIITDGETIGRDSRAEVAKGRKMICPGTWMFGHAFGLPTEWMLEVNGVDESWCSVSMEDTHFGQMLDNNRKVIYHDPRMAQVQDRTPDACSYDMKRSSKEKHPNDKNDKTHKLIEKLWHNKQSAHPWDFQAIRKQILMGGLFPIPIQPTFDEFDGQKLADMV